MLGADLDWRDCGNGTHPLGGKLDRKPDPTKKAEKGFQRDRKTLTYVEEGKDSGGREGRT